MYIDLLSVLKGISGMLSKAPEDPYVACGKEQLDSVIKGLEGKPRVLEGNLEAPEAVEALDGEEGLDPGAAQAREELMS